MNILFLVPYPLNESPSQRFRFEQYFEILQINGYYIKYQSFWGLAAWQVLYKPNHIFRKTYGFISGSLSRLAILIQVPKTDYVFIHRECLPMGPPIIEWIIAKLFGKKVIYDFDDAIWLPNTSKENRLATLLKYHSKIKFICKWSYKISCGNSYLRNFAELYNTNVISNPTTIDSNQLHNPALYNQKNNSNYITIGWTGTHSTLKYLDAIESVLVSLEEKFRGKIKFLIIADKRPLLKISFQFLPWSIETEINDLLKIDVGIMPLTDDIWAQGKCGFKVLQYMSLEIPAVASSVGVNTSIISHGIDGFLCKNNDDWIVTLMRLIEDEKLRRQIGKNARKKVIQSYSVESNARNFLSLFS